MILVKVDRFHFPKWPPTATSLTNFGLHPCTADSLQHLIMEWFENRFKKKSHYEFIALRSLVEFSSRSFILLGEKKKHVKTSPPSPRPVLHWKSTILITGRHLQNCAGWFEGPALRRELRPAANGRTPFSSSTNERALFFLTKTAGQLHRPTRNTHSVQKKWKKSGRFKKNLHKKNENPSTTGPACSESAEWFLRKFLVSRRFRCGECGRPPRKAHQDNDNWAKVQNDSSTLLKISSTEEKENKDRNAIRKLFWRRRL